MLVSGPLPAPTFPPLNVWGAASWGTASALNPLMAQGQPVTLGANLNANALNGHKPLAGGWPLYAPSAPDRFSLGRIAGGRPFRTLQAQRLADRFCKATLQDWGTDELEIKDTLKTVMLQGLLPEFETAVRQKAAQQGVMVRNAEDVINRKMAGNILTRYFQAAPREECLDYLRMGRNTYSASPWAYRRYGMYRSVIDFVGVCRKHPVMSVSVIGTTAYLGDKYPFVGAVSGLGLLAWAAIMSLVNEVKATKHPFMGAGKAEHYKQSGENLAAVLMTAPGYHGIAEGSAAGLKVLTHKGKAPEGLTLDKMPQGLWGAVSLDKDSKVFEILAKGPRAVQPDGKQGLKDQVVSLMKRGLFVFGLFDNVLLPFNCLADQLDEDNDTAPLQEA